MLGFLLRVVSVVFPSCGFSSGVLLCAAARAHRPPGFALLRLRSLFARSQVKVTPSDECHIRLTSQVVRVCIPLSAPASSY